MSERAFVGREEKLAAIAACVDAAAAGRAQVVWVEGDAGSGKSALLREVLARLPAAFQLLRTEADELAGDVPLGTLAGLGPIGAPGAFAAGLELLALLAAAQDAGPVAVVVEDLHWADAVSRQALLAAARRLNEDQVVLLISSRPDPRGADGWQRFCDDPDRCLRVVLGGLSVAEIGELARRLGKNLTGRHAEQLHRHTRGHALYVWTLLNELTPDQLAVPDSQLPVPRSLATATVAQLAALPEDARLLAAALSVVNQRSPLSVVGRIAGLGQPTQALESLLATGLVTWQPAEIQTPVQFAHPLYRAAVYNGLPPTQRQALHRSAAHVLDASAALAHRVAATDHFDDGLADEVEAAARDELDRGAAASAATHLLWASPLTSARDQRERRLLTAMRLLLADRQPARAAGLREQAAACEPSALRNLILGMLALDQGDAAAERWLLAVTAADGDGRQPTSQGDSRADILAAALGGLGFLYANQGRAAEAVTVAARAISLQPADRSQERAAWRVLALGEGWLRGAPAGLDRLSARLPSAAESVSGADADLLVVRGTLGYYAARTTTAISDLRAAVGLAQEGLPPVHLARAHLHLSQLLFGSGEWDEALVNARLALSLTADERVRWIEAQAHAVLATVAASRGEWATAAGQLSAADSAAAALGTPEALFTARIAQAALARARDEPDAVVDSLQPLTDNGDIRTVPMLSSLGWCAVLIAANIDRGAVDAAALQVDQLAQAAADRVLDLRARILGLRARVAQARGDLDQAAFLYQQALAMFGPDDPLLDRALLQHAFGSLLRARGRRSAAQGQLRSAHRLLAAMGAEPFRGRVAEDLARSGLRSAGAGSRAPLALTDREQDVVTLVVNGLTNRQVADELYVSQKAVEYHLSNVFGKLGVTSRRELRDRVAG